MPSNQAGKGPQPRSYDTAAAGSGYERVFGKKKPWWEVRDERAAQEEDDDDIVRPEDALSTGPDPIADQATSAEDLAKRLAKEFMRRGQYEGAEGGLTPEPEPPPFNPYQVPVVDASDSGFGDYLSVSFPNDQLVIVMSRGPNHGWLIPLNLRHPRLPHQIYTAGLPTEVSKEIVVVGLNTGTWVTVWASSPSEITHPAKA